jgi:hypothetical protein
MNLQRMNFTKYFALTCDSTYEVTSLSYSAGKISVEFDYTEDMEGRHCTVTLAYDPTIVDRPPSQLSFDAKSQNAPLIISNKLSEYAQIRFLFGIIALIALGLFVISLPRKMPGVELLSCCQTAFLSLCLYERPLFLYNSLKGLSIVTGGWSLFA